MIFPDRFKSHTIQTLEPLGWPMLCPPYFDRQYDSLNRLAWKGKDKLQAICSICVSDLHSEINCFSKFHYMFMICTAQGSFIWKETLTFQKDCKYQNIQKNHSIWNKTIVSSINTQCVFFKAFKANVYVLFNGCILFRFT